MNYEVKKEIKRPSKRLYLTWIFGQHILFIVFGALAVIWFFNTPVSNIDIKSAISLLVVLITLDILKFYCFFYTGGRWMKEDNKYEESAEEEEARRAIRAFLRVRGMDN